MENNNVIIKAPWTSELENMNGITLKGDNNTFDDLEWIIDTSKCIVSEKEYTDKVECEMANECNNDCHKCAGNFNTHIYRMEISSIIGKSKLIFEAYSGDTVGDCFSDLYFIGVESI